MPCTQSTSHQHMRALSQAQARVSMPASARSSITLATSEHTLSSSLYTHLTNGREDGDY
uniref:Uncharacterized protein n=1 Tax=Arundo donax TaxID=35708 RepID=A0A0A9ELW1_ARUDO